MAIAAGPRRLGPPPTPLSAAPAPDPRQALLDSVRAPAIVLDPDGRVALLNRAWQDRALPGAGDREVGALGDDYPARVRGAVERVPELAALADVLRDVLAGASAGSALEYRSPGAPPRWFEVQVTPLDGGGALVQHVDVTARHEAMAALAAAAARDALTGLANRGVLLARLDAALARPGTAAVLFLDLDDFKLINDGLGHSTGDRLLVEVADRLRAVARPGTRSPASAATSSSCSARTSAARRRPLAIAALIRDALDRPFALGGQQRQVSASIGCRIARRRRSTATTLLRDADVAMYEAKAGGKDRAVTFSDAMRGGPCGGSS